ncbi:hypothetical protein Nepgr_032656 [Nepenthes gracilis]|uniref:Uncharacterized protein n=1 Tax=Nepenthes gracilis TaxID=150966 RepID=A0AAD3TJ17_NEPGR|nr:hypothetical protein Nepgr_032656 [Nepenthes gracilis]
MCLRKQLVEIKAQHCLDLQLPSCSQAARDSVPDETSPGSEAAVQDVKLHGVAVPPSCPQGLSVGWTDDDLFAKQAVVGWRTCPVFAWWLLILWEDGIPLHNGVITAYDLQ